MVSRRICNLHGTSLPTINMTTCMAGCSCWHWFWAHLEGEQGDDKAPAGKPPGLGEVDKGSGRGQRADAVGKDQAGEGACIKVP